MSTLNGSEWNKQDIHNIWEKVADVAANKYNLTWFEPQFEIVNSEGMMHAYTTNALPNLYDHWSFGKHYESYKKDYDKHPNLANEVIINSDPAICYLWENNTLMQMVTVLAHAAVGHSSFFKNNYMYKEWTDPSSILPFCNYAKRYIKSCELTHGYKEVELFIDALHSLKTVSFDKTALPPDKSEATRKSIILSKIEDDRLSANSLFDSLESLLLDKTNQVPEDTTEKYDNILRVFLKHGDLPVWKRNIIIIFMYINQYIYPHHYEKMMNEGYATFWHNILVKDLHEEDFISNGMFLEHLHFNGHVCYQSKFSSTHSGIRHVNSRYSNINPYFFGSSIFNEIKRVCIEQDEESLRYCPLLKGKNWVDAVQYAMENFRDDSFIHQFLTPRLARELKLSVVTCDRQLYGNYYLELEIAAANAIEDFQHIKKSFSEAYSFTGHLPNIEFMISCDADKTSARVIPTLYVIYHRTNGVDLKEDYRKMTLKYIKNIWRSDVVFKEGL